MWLRVASVWDGRRMGFLSRFEKDSVNDKGIGFRWDFGLIGTESIF